MSAESPSCDVDISHKAKQGIMENNQEKHRPTKRQGLLHSGIEFGDKIIVSGIWG